MLALEIVTLLVAVSATGFSIFLHFWNKRKVADLEAEITKLQEKGIKVQMDTVLNAARTSSKKEKA
ncbi:hypothetical protein FOH24_04560 [Acetobacter tropicalis]|uniref:Uncharacterized protein n=1 Tax=Acetobacter tropicalis TaxID=104102 RepID=A0A094YLY5_9PROT|nr:hypothetical protein [Acetobacter tropicalis]KAA8390131.1 hypothetical protein FOH22_04610 [Acetobacter tropicalis]KAA8391959.1 hypothetical protein FOH24_04560 [Acetobacter tropicalis]KGB22347.1 hypothetical protein AtDm6_2358 [Acetobacter tropicalis]KXV47559.1 hypothetical protein AD944_11670 [Acetobacter tropicalis]KXV56949.1 hypothetical protein AD947_09845 [Acetobacter tropicalis]